MQSIQIKLERLCSSYGIGIGQGTLSKSGEWASESLGGRRGQIIVVSNSRVFGLYGEIVQASLVESGFEVAVYLIKDGEKYKNFRTLQQILTFFSENGLSRTGAVVALGGGVVGDIAGFASSIYLRGIAFLQIPTTLLAMIDSSVGGKTGINSDFGKNLIGSFYQPSGVLVDVGSLATLPKREMTAGLCEAVKQGIVGGRHLFGQIGDFLNNHSSADFAKSFDSEGFVEGLAYVVASQVAFKAGIVANDERESPDKTDAKSRKILNFGHTFGHALEKITRYRYLKHGEAVGYGILFASSLSKNLGLLASDEVNSLNDVVHRAGKLPPIDNIDPESIFETFKYDKKVINDSLQWVLIKGVGKPVIFPHSEIPHSALTAAFDEIIHR